MKYRIVRRGNGRIGIDKAGHRSIYPWTRLISAQQGSMIIPLEFDTEEEAENYIMRLPCDTPEEVLKEVTR